MALINHVARIWPAGRAKSQGAQGTPTENQKLLVFGPLLLSESNSTKKKVKESDFCRDTSEFAF